MEACRLNQLNTEATDGSNSPTLKPLEGTNSSILTFQLTRRLCVSQHVHMLNMCECACVYVHECVHMCSKLLVFNAQPTGTVIISRQYTLQSLLIIKYKS